MATAFTVNIDKIVFTSPNMPSPSPAGLRSHILPDTLDLGTWYESGTSMYRVAINQDIYDTSYSQGINRPVFGYSGIVASGTTFQEGIDNYIYVYTEQEWLTSLPFNLYIDDNSWFEVTDISYYNYAPTPPPTPALLPTTFTTSGTLTTSRNITINVCCWSYNSLNYIFNTEDIYSFDTATETYTQLTSSIYNIDYPVTMIGYNNALYIFYISDGLLRCTSYQINSDHWTMYAYTTLHQNATTSSELGSYLIDSKIYVTPKYDESSIPAYIYIYIYDINANSWTSEHVDTCGEYNLNISNSMLASDGNYIYILERYSRLLHKIDLTSKNDTQFITNTDTDINTSIILKGDKIYIYIPSNNVFENINVTNGQTQTLNAPTLKNVDTNISEGTFLSTDGVYLYLSINKGVQWITETWLYQYDISGNSWSYLDVPTAGGVPFTGNMCTYSSDIYGVDQESLYIFNNTINGWKKLTNLPRDDAQDTIICCDGTFIYTLINQCGYFWKYDISNDNWVLLQTVSLPAPTAYDGTKPGNMCIDNGVIYLGLYYNNVTSTRDTFFYKYNTSDDTWATYVAPKTTSNRSFFMYPYIQNNYLMLAGCIQYLNSPVNTYRYTIYKQTDIVNNTWEESNTIDINDIPNSKYFCMYGQLLVDTILYINFTTADNLGFSCSGPVCRMLDTDDNTCAYWLPNPITTMFMAALDASYIYYIDLTSGLMYTYSINPKTTTIKAIPRKSYVNYFICMRGSIKYLFGKQEIEYNPALYKYTFTVYRQSGSSWAVVNTYSETSTSQGTLKLNPIQNYCFVTDTVYMASYLKHPNDIYNTQHKQYRITSDSFTDFDIDDNVTYITKIDTNTLGLAQLNSLYTYDITAASTTLFIDGISGNRASAYLYIYQYNGNLRAIGGQYYTPATGSKYITYEKTTNWSVLKEQAISTNFFNTLDYTQYGTTIYCINTINHTEYDIVTDIFSYVSNHPTTSTMCCSGINNTINLYSDNYNCPSYNYNGLIFTTLAGDIYRTNKASNTITTTSGDLAFIKNSVTNEISYIHVDINTYITTTTDTIFGDTPFIFEYNSILYALLPKYNSLVSIINNTISTLITNLDIATGCHGTIVNDNLYFTKGTYTFGFYKINMTTNTVTELEMLPFQASIYASITNIPNYIIYITENKLYKYNINTNTWEFIQTLQDNIAWKGIETDATYIYFCGTSYIYKITITDMSLENSYYGPLPVSYNGSFCKNNNNFIIHYNDALVQYNCTYIYSDDFINILDITSVTHYPPTTIPYNLKLRNDKEKEVEIEWKIASVLNITHYRVYRREPSTSKIYVGSTTTLSFIDTTADRGKQFYYSVRACNEYGCTTNTSTELYVQVYGSEYKYAFKTQTWQNQVKATTELPSSNVYRWGNSNLSFDNTVILTVTFGEAYDCYITAWDDTTHTTTTNLLLSNECYRISACAFASASASNLEEPSYKALYFRPMYNVVLKGDENFYGKFNINYEPLQNRYGAYIIFKPILINLPIAELIKGKYEFITSLHYKYT